MSRETLTMTPQILDYIARVGLEEHPVQSRCRAETAEMGGVAVMQIAPEQGAFLAMLVRLIGARQVLEVGSFTGYSALSMALALPQDGRIVACDVSEEYTGKARGYWQEAGVADKIDLHIAPAAETLAGLIADGHTGAFDFAFIDADKTGYDAYYEHCLILLRPGGLIAIDNVLWSGKVADEAATDEDTSALRALNAKVHTDVRVDHCLVPLADGVMLARKR